LKQEHKQGRPHQVPGEPQVSLRLRLQRHLRQCHGIQVSTGRVYLSVYWIYWLRVKQIYLSIISINRKPNKSVYGWCKLWFAWLIA